MDDDDSAGDLDAGGLRPGRYGTLVGARAGVVAGHVAVGGEDGDSGAVTADGDGIADRYRSLVAAGLGV